MATELLTGDGEVLAYFESKQPKASDSNIVPAEGSAHYTVGWICAVTTEYVAAQAFLPKATDYIVLQSSILYMMSKVAL